MSSRKESSCTNQNTLTTSIAKIGSAVNSPRNRLFQIRQQQTPVSSSSSIYNPPQRRVVNLDTWPNNAGSFDNNNAAMAQMYSSRWGVYDNTTFNIGYNDGGFSKLPPLNMNGIDNNSMDNLDHNQFSPKHTMMNNSPNMSPNNYMQQNMNNNPFTTVQTSNSNTLNDSLFHQNQQQQQNLNTHNNQQQNHQISVTMQNSNFHHTNNQINNTTTNFQTQHSQQPCIDLNTTSFNPQHTIEQQNNTNTLFQQSQQTQHNVDHRQTINSVNNTSNFQQQNIFNQFDQQQTEINSAIPQSLVDIVMEMEEETPEQTFEQMLTDHNKNIQNTCSYGNSPVPETFNDDSMMDISDMNDIFTNIPSIRPPSTWNFDIVEQNNKMNIENFGSSTSQLINELKKENLKAEPAVSINSLSTTSMITEQIHKTFNKLLKTLSRHCKINKI
uniref:Uncharacterized protein n=1 Tax=Clytia hemisphaerica TaxID=252671 RepID=A0A7M5UK75_9CNID